MKRPRAVVLCLRTGSAATFAIFPVDEDASEGILLGIRSEAVVWELTQSAVPE